MCVRVCIMCIHIQYICVYMCYWYMCDSRQKQLFRKMECIPLQLCLARIDPIQRDIRPTSIDPSHTHIYTSYNILIHKSKYIHATSYTCLIYCRNVIIAWFLALVRAMKHCMKWRCVTTRCDFISVIIDGLFSNDEWHSIGHRFSFRASP